MPSCENGHEQKLGLKCKVCGAALSYRQATNQLLSLPKVIPDFGKTATIYASVPQSDGKGGYSLVVASGDAPRWTKDEFVLTKIQGGTWLDFYSKNSADLSRWLKVVAFGESNFKFLFVDTTNPLSVLTIASIAQHGQTAVVAITADLGSTPMEQNTSYVAISVALKRGLHVLALPRSLIRQSPLVEEGGNLFAPEDALLRMVSGLLGQQDGLMDLLERDSRIGVAFHLLSPILSGSMQIYGKASNVFAVQSYQLPRGVKLEDAKTFHALVSCGKDLKGEFEKSFAQFRNKRLKEALNAECTLQEHPDPRMFDLFAVYGLDESSVLQESFQGYTAVTKRAPVLKVGSVT